MDNSTTHHLYIKLCVHPSSGLQTSPFITTPPPRTLLHHSISPSPRNHHRVVNVHEFFLFFFSFGQTVHPHLRKAIINKSINDKCWGGCGEEGTLMHCWWECRLVQPLWITVCSSLKKLKMELLYDPVITLLGIYPKKPETLIQKNLCTCVFIAVYLQ